MDKAKEICERHELVGLIKKISAYYGGDDPEWLKSFATEVIKERDREKALDCFRDLAKITYF